MGGTTDIIARLQLRAEQFSSETGKAFADMKTRAESTAQQVRGSFNSSFAEVQRLAANALTLPRTTGGALDLSGEIGQLTNARAAAVENAEGLRQIAVAAEAAAGAEGVLSEKLRLRADAASVASLAAERDVAAIDQELVGLRAMQTELDRTAKISGVHAAAIRRTGEVSGATRAGMQQLSYQLNDIAGGFSSGTPPMQIFAQQAGQVTQAIGLMTTETKGLLGFLGGSYGLILTSAVVLLAPFVGKLFESADASDKAAGAHGRQADAAKTLTDAIAELDRITGASHKTHEQEVVDAERAARALYEQEIRTRNLTKAKLAAQLADLRAGDRFAQPGEAGVDAVSGYRAGQAGQIAALQGQIAAQDADIGKAAQSFRGATADRISGEVARGADAAAAATHRFEQRSAELRAQLAAGTKDEREFRAELEAATRARDAAIDATRKHAAAHDGAAASARAEAAAAREAARAHEQLVASVQKLTAVGDPAAAAAATFREQVANIEALVRSGELDPDAAAAAGRAAAAAYRQALEQQLESFRSSHPPLTIASRDLTEGIDAKGTVASDLREAGYASGQEFGRGAQGSIREVSETLQSVLGIKLGAGPSRVLSLLGGAAKPGDDFAVGLKSVFAPLERAFLRNTASIDATFKNGGTFKQALGELAGGAALGGVGGSAFASITGGRDSKFASAAGGAIGEVAGKKLGNLAAAQIGGKLGGFLKDFGGPLGSIAGGVLGNVLTGFLSKPQKGGATITSLTGNATTFGNSAAAISAGSSSAKGVQQAIQQIANQLGATTGTFSPITIGTYGKNNEYRLNTTGGTTLGGSKSAIAGVEYFASGDEGQQAAIARAIQIEIEHGVIQGISQASQNIIRSGQDLTTSINKALLIEAIPRDLKAMLDPVGAAMDALNKKWKTTVDALNEGGASTEQLAQAERLHKLQLDQVIATTASATQGLKDFRSSFMAGSNSPYSLRDQEVAVKSTLQPFLDAIGSGSAIDQAKYQQAAQGYLDVERQLYGSTQQYFDALDAIQSATSKAISTIDNAVPIGGTVADPFAAKTADSTAATAAAVEAANQLTVQNGELLKRIAWGIESLGGKSAGISDFIGTTRSFAA